MRSIDDFIERGAIDLGACSMKCTVCKGPAVMDVRRHNANFCAEHFLKLCRDQVAKAIKEFDMLRPDDRVLVAVSGGKDSLAVWDLLLELGYQADGLYLGLGIGGYSDASGEMTRAFARDRGLHLIEVDLPTDHGFDIPTGAKAAKRVPCSACGLSKRHLFDEAARTGGYDVVVTGHNLDDEAAVLFGNVLHWQADYLGRQLPVLPARNGFPKKVKPLVRLGERETAAYCVIRGIDYIVEECPMAEGNKHLGYKEALNAIEVRSPGSKHDFYFGFLARASARFTPDAEAEQEQLGACARCGAPTPLRKPTEPSGEGAQKHGAVGAPGSDAVEAPGLLCAFCRLQERASTAVPVQLGTKP